MNVFVSGGSRGIGAALVRELHAQGHRTVFTYERDKAAADRLCAQLQERVWALRCDLSDYDALPAVVESAKNRLGTIDTLVNNAGIFADNPFFANTYERWRAGWERTFSVNLFGTAHLTYLLLQHMRQAGGGRIINVASRAAHRGELQYADYGASKAGLVNFTKSIARSCGQYNIISIAIAPGFVETDMAAEELEVRGDEIESEIPLGRVGSASEVAAVIAFFACGRGDYATGSTIDLNGASYVR
ncbi:MAG TPA: SDR family NAD(P)-dependent oxidoreductase [Candidatus Baltobacteraceae bacterium]|nr:SDR family NAD(P)-dependent oxidoreductase [Candidatus Baltobacteraceae bacterium]